jgi:hypothetical protein
LVKQYLDTAPRGKEHLIFLGMIFAGMKETQPAAKLG